MKILFSGVRGWKIARDLCSDTFCSALFCTNSYNSIQQILLRLRVIASSSKKIQKTKSATQFIEGESVDDNRTERRSIVQFSNIYLSS